MFKNKTEFDSYVIGIMEGVLMTISDGSVDDSAVVAQAVLARLTELRQKYELESSGVAILSEENKNI